MKSKIIALCLLAAMLFGAASCGGETASQPTIATDAAADTAAATEAETTSPYAYLPECDYDGRTLRMLLRTIYEQEFHIEEENGEVLNDSLFRRNSMVAERCNVDYAYTVMDAEWGGGDKWGKSLTSTILAGDDAYDLCAAYGAMALSFAQKDYFINWHSVPTVDFSNPWWSEQLADCLTIGDTMYAITGDIALSIWYEMFAVFYNQKVAAEVGANDLYDTVRKGVWTYEAMRTLAQTVSADINGDGAFTADDKYGYASTNSTSIDTYQQAFGVKVMDKDADGMLIFALNTPRAVSAMEAMCELYYGEYTFYDKTSSDNALVMTMMKEDRALFVPATLNDAANYLRDMDSDFGILPYPKLDDAQDRYYSSSRDNFSLMMIPATETDLEFVGTLTETLAVVSNQEVVPVYYEIVLKDKYSRDEGSAEMLDVIRDGLIFDIGYLNSYGLEGAGHLFVNLVRSKSTDIASQCAKNEAKINAKLESMLENYR